MITIPAPSLPGSTLAMETPLAVTLSGLTFGNGSAVAVADVTTIGLLVFRGAPGSGEVWDATQKSWKAAPADDQLLLLKPLVATSKDGTPSWTATLVGIGQKDGAGNDVYAPASGGSPSYFLRTLAKANHAGAVESGLSPASPTFTFTSSTANARYTAAFDTPTTKPDQAHKVRMQLKGDAMQPAGYIEIRALPSFEVEIANCDAGGNTLAKMVLQSDGAIHLTPATGSRVVIDGDAETNRIFYAPYGGGAKLWLA